MNNCPTGYCGYPCLCKGSLDHLGRSETEALQKLVTSRLTDIDSKEMSDKWGELMVPYAAVEVQLVALKYDGRLQKCDHLLHRIILRKGSEGIRTVSGLRTVLVDPETGEPTFIAGHDNRSNTRISFDVMDWNGEIGVSVDCIGGYIQDAYTKLNYTTVFLPADME